MVVIARMGVVEPNPDFPGDAPPSPTPSSTTPTPTDIIASATSGTTSTPTNSTDANGFIQIAANGTSGDKILRGFLIGMAIGVVVSFVLCCWMPCCRKKRRSRLQRRNDNIRRRLVVLEDEDWVNQNWPRRRPWEVGDDESHASHD